EAILAHELGHVRRNDYLVNLLQSVIETLLFYHPAVWWVSHQMRLEREHCCDELAVTVCGDRLIYARALTRLEEFRCDSLQVAMAANGGLLPKRVQHVLGSARQRSQGSTSWIAALISVLAVLMLAVGSVATHSALQQPSRKGPEKREVAGFPSQNTLPEHTGQCLL